MPSGGGAGAESAFSTVGRNVSAGSAPAGGLEHGAVMTRINTAAIAMTTAAEACARLDRRGRMFVGFWEGYTCVSAFLSLRPILARALTKALAIVRG